MSDQEHLRKLREDERFERTGLRVEEALTLEDAPSRPENEGPWFKRSGDARLESCATEGCGGAPIWRLEVNGTGSNYCSGCKAKIVEMTSTKDKPTGGMEYLYVKRFRTLIMVGPSIRDEVKALLDGPEVTPQDGLASVSRIACLPGHEETMAGLDSLTIRHQSDEYPQEENNEVNDAYARGEHILGVTK